MSTNIQPPPGGVSALAVGAESLALTHYSNRIKSTEEPVSEAKSAAGALPVVALNDNDRMVVDDEGRVHHLSGRKPVGRP